MITGGPGGGALAVSFDLDGTLVTSPFAGVLHSVAAEITAETGEVAADVAADILAEHERRLLADPYAAYDWASIVAATAGRFGSRWSGSLVSRLEDALADPGVRVLHENTRASLEALRATGCRVVLLTNGRGEFQVPVLRAAGLHDVFDDVVTSDAVGTAKPAPEMFGRALGDRSRLVHVGDRLDHDIAGAAAVGAAGILLRPDTPGDGRVATSGKGICLTDGRGGVGPDISSYLLVRHRIEVRSPVGALPSCSVPDGVARNLDAAVALILELQSAAL